mmetsp:Transcript_9819/g.25807  ORF Transcript_9819/g.25807 Transcript_9819/m.25807 type:complete len:471 (+) Transcript_9819:73-1485(+)
MASKHTSCSRSRSPLRRTYSKQLGSPERQINDVQADAAGDASEVVFGPKGYDFSKPEAIPEASRQRVQERLQSGRLFRYGGDVSDVAELERTFSEYVGLPYTMACNSGGCGIFLALKALGVRYGDKVLINAFTLAPVPGAVVHAGATPVFVDCERDTLTIDVEDLTIKASESGAKVLVMSYMRGQVPDIDLVMTRARALDIKVVEDCAHTLGCTWKPEGEDKPRHLGSFGEVGVWSCQTNKSINSGEGGIISTARQDLASFITVATGSYGHFHQNGASGDVSDIERVYCDVPNMSMRMSNIAALIAIPQLALLNDKLAAWRDRAAVLRRVLGECPHACVIRKQWERSGKVVPVWSSIQFMLPQFSSAMVEELVEEMSKRHVPLAWFGGHWRGFTSTVKDWNFASSQTQVALPNYSGFVQILVDLPLYHTTTWPISVMEALAELLRSVICEIAEREDSSATASQESEPDAV